MTNIQGQDSNMDMLNLKPETTGKRALNLGDPAALGVLPSED
ncbi:hypothetical protein MARI_14830 [Marinobacter sp. JH2]|nr:MULTISPECIES: hypothetical protein [unclassified Marinobacter]QBM17374.1 hypothetical protein MARI_14830 [Marinobacter sp. JH2]